MNKSEWINAWVNNKNFNSVDKNVIQFIADVLYHSGDEKLDECETIYNLFACGYCFYFANMLKMAFNRGTVCWHKGFGHIVWLDENNVAYDIGGVFYDYADGDLVNVSELGESIIDFMHVNLK